MEITLKVSIGTDGATRDQVEHFPEEVRRTVEQMLMDWSPTEVTVTLEGEQ